MDMFDIEGKINSPTINFNPDTGILKIYGRSIPENPVKFYQPIENWISSFLETNPSKIILHIYLDYLNTHSTECVLILIKKIEGYYLSSKSDIKVIWNFDVDDEDMQTLGEDLSSISEIPFEIIQVIEED
jgi:hypothetical protein